MIARTQNIIVTVFILFLILMSIISFFSPDEKIEQKEVKLIMNFDDQNGSSVQESSIPSTHNDQ